MDAGLVGFLDHRNFVEALGHRQRKGLITLIRVGAENRLNQRRHAGGHGKLKAQPRISTGQAMRHTQVGWQCHAALAPRRAERDVSARHGGNVFATLQRRAAPGRRICSQAGVQNVVLQQAMNKPNAFALFRGVFDQPADLQTPLQCSQNEVRGVWSAAQHGDAV